MLLEESFSTAGIHGLTSKELTVRKLFLASR